MHRVVVSSERFPDSRQPSKYLLDPPSFFQLHSSFIPSPSDEYNIRKSIQNVEGKIESVNEEIARLRHALLELEGSREHLYESISKHRAVLAPIRRLPPEILRLVFNFAAEGCAVHYPPPQRHSMPWTLGYVCSYWREVMLSLPQPWAELDIDLFPLNNYLADGISFMAKLHSAEQFLKCCLQRSGNELLKFSLRGKGADAATRSILTILVEHAERWQEAYLEFDIYDFLSTLSPVMHRLGNLSSLSIFSYQRPVPVPIVSPFDDAPKLTKLSISGAHNPFYTLILPWHQITHLTSKSNSFQQGEFIEIMRRTQNLTSFHTDSERILEVASSHAVLLPHLKKLSVINKGSYIAKVFQFLIIPNLEELCIQATTPFLGDQTVPMIRQSKCNPTHLTFQSSLLTTSFWEENLGVVLLLSSMRSITHLNITVIHSSNDIMSRLFLRRAHGPNNFLPELSSISVDDRLCLSAEKVIDAMSSRIANYDQATYGAWPKDQNGLKDIVLKLSRPPPPSYPELERLRAAAEEHGVGIVIEST